VTRWGSVSPLSDRGETGGLCSIFALNGAS
jgi:hypothetical protein